MKDTSGIRLSWTPSSDVDTVGYKVYAGQSADTMTLIEDVGNTTWVVLGETYSSSLISVAAYDSSGNVGVRSTPVTASQCGVADIDCSGSINLTDAVLCLQMLSGIDNSSITVYADVNEDQKIGLEEAVYILKNIAGLY